MCGEEDLHDSALPFNIMFVALFPDHLPGKSSWKVAEYKLFSYPSAGLKKVLLLMAELPSSTSTEWMMLINYEALHQSRLSVLIESQDQSAESEIRSIGCSTAWGIHPPQASDVPVHDKSGRRTPPFEVGKLLYSFSANFF